VRRVGGRAIRLSGEIAQVVAETMPYVTTALSAYGGAALGKVEDGAADFTVNFGRWLVQRIFQRRKNDDSLPPALAGVAEHPGDPDYLATLSAAIRSALESDAQMLAEVQEILAKAKVAAAGRDLYHAGRDITINNYSHAQPDAQDGSSAERQVVVGLIPREPLAFMDRDAHIHLIRAARRDEVTVVSAVTGLRGVGKTQLAAAYARSRASEGCGLVGWVNAETRDTTLADLARIADRLGVGDPEGDSLESTRRLQEHLKIRPNERACWYSITRQTRNRFGPSCRPSGERRSW
jgi:hypothetical protein